jgi:SNF2 family DNA or RNA helicase
MSDIIDIKFTDRSKIKTKLRKLQFDNKDTFDLTLTAFQLLSKIKESKLSIVSSIKSNKAIELYDHQIFAAMKVKNEFGGSAILADEVGLGKTMEAGIILKEFLISGLAKSVLILVPPSLVYQWQDELQTKFNLSFAQKDDSDFIDPASHELLIFSHSSATSPRKSKFLKKRNWDMVIVDEAHSMKNSSTLKHQLLKELSRKFTLFLSATPIQNNLSELYNLVELLKPGTFGTLSEFKTRYADDPQMRRINPFFKEELQKKLSKIIIRTTRQQVKKYIKFTDRIAFTKILKPTDDERDLYDKITNKVHKYYDSGYDILYLMVIQRLISSSTESTKQALFKMKKSGLFSNDDYDELMEIANRIKLDTKTSDLVDVIKDDKDSKFLIFTEFHVTQDYLAKVLNENGFSVTLFNGKMNLIERLASVEQFRNETQIMISTSAGGEGQNFQFCHNVVNYDLPWNPMKVEQRVGRVHRIGQKNDVNIYNYAYENTIDAYILQLLYTKIKLFTMTIGHLDLLFEDVTDEKTGVHFFKEYISAKNEQELKNNFSTVGENLKTRKKDLTNAVEEFNQEVFENFSLSPTGETNVSN